MKSLQLKKVKSEFDTLKNREMFALAIFWVNFATVKPFMYGPFEPTTLKCSLEATKVLEYLLLMNFYLFFIVKSKTLPRFKMKKIFFDC